MFAKARNALLILLGGALLIALISLGKLRITGTPIWDCAIVFAVTNLLFYIAVRRGSLKARQQIAILATAAVLQIAPLLAFRFDGFADNGLPVLRFAWHAPTEEKILVHTETGIDADGFDIVSKEWMSPAEYREYLKKQKETFIPEASSNAVDLTRTTAHDSPGFRGADRSGVIRGVRLARNWKENPPQLVWRHPMGFGWSAFAVVGNFAVTQDQKGGFESVACYELQTGKLCWEHQYEAYFAEGSSSEGPRATPTIHEGRVYTMGATGVLNCLNGATGAVIWRRNILEEHQIENRTFGMVGSPLIVDDKVIVCPGAEKASMVAYHRLTGEKIWSGGSAISSYSSPQLEIFGGRRQILNFNGEGIYSHDLLTGKVLWSFPWVSNPPEKNNVCQPIFFPTTGAKVPDRVFIASGYDRGCAMLAIESTNDKFSVKPLWMTRSMKAKFTNAVHHNGFVYGLDENILVCVNAKTGAREWKDGRFGWGQVMLADDLLVVQAETGEIALVDANPKKYQLVARFRALKDRTWNHPCIVGDLLLARNDREAACYRIPLAKEQPASSK